MLNILYLALLIAFIVSVIAFLIVRVKQGGVKALFLKTISAVLFIFKHCNYFNNKVDANVNCAA